ncbi:MAG: DUF4258 domain-containing protein [Candidatus Wallbacteria bacterium]|nr:DUF4258 domain-containing protein [Candidatus Wallbacteria bacterium]
MRILIDPHTAERATERGVSSSEITETICLGADIPAKHGRMGKSLVFGYNQVRNGKMYPQKKVEVYFAVSDDTIVTVTVYAFYGQWEDL